MSVVCDGELETNYFTSAMIIEVGRRLSECIWDDRVMFCENYHAGFQIGVDGTQVEFTAYSISVPKDLHGTLDSAYNVINRN